MTALRHPHALYAGSGVVGDGVNFYRDGDACTCNANRITVPKCSVHPPTLTCGAVVPDLCKPGGCGWCRGYAPKEMP